MTSRIDELFRALADGTRREILVLLASGEKRVTDLAGNFSMSLPAVSKHIRVLEHVGLIDRRVDGRDHFLRAVPQALGEIRAQIALLQGMWSDTLATLEETLLEEDMSEFVAKANRLIKADAGRVFDAWLDAAKMAKFMCPIPGGSATAKAKAEVGGEFEVVMIAPDGQSIPHTGVYKVVDRPNKLEFTWSSPYVKDSIVTISFTPMDGGTQVDLVHTVLPDQESADNHTGGWLVILEQLETLSQ